MNNGVVIKVVNESAVDEKRREIQGQEGMDKHTIYHFRRKFPRFEFTICLLYYAGTCNSNPLDGVTLISEMAQ